MRNLLFASALVSSVLFINGCDGECCQNVPLTQSVSVKGNQTPIPVITGLPTEAPCGTELTAYGTNSYDPDGTIASYIWKLDGTTLNGSESASAVLPCDGKTHQVCLTVVDNEGLQQTTCQTININNEKTQPPISSCDLQPKITYEKGHSLQYKFYCKDTIYDGEKIDPNKAICEWKVSKTLIDGTTKVYQLTGPLQWINVDAKKYKALDITLSVKNDDCEASITEHYLLPKDLPCPCQYKQN
jgi:hypothetical protein